MFSRLQKPRFPVTLTWSAPAVALLGIVMVCNASAQKDVMLMNRIGPSTMEIFVANADGSDEHPLLANAPGLNYDASFAADGQWIVFTSERDPEGPGQADIWRVRPDGSGLERLTTSTAMDDAGMLSPDGKRLAYVSTKGGARTANIWIKDLPSGKETNLTGDGDSKPKPTMNGNFRPAWSPDGQWIAFTSDRGEKWIGAEGGAGAGHSHPTSLYIVHPDGSGLKRLTSTTPESAFGSPQWSADGSKILAYEIPTRDTFGARMWGFGIAMLNSTSQIVEINVATGEKTALSSGSALKTNPHYLPGGKTAWLIKATPMNGPEPGIVYADGSRGPKGLVRNPSWSPDGKRVVYYRFGAVNRPQNTRLYSWNQDYEYRYTDVFQAVCPANGRMALTDLDFPFGNTNASISVMDRNGGNRSKVFQRQDGAALMATWSPDCQWIAFGFGVFFGGRGFAPANVFMVKADGSESKQVTQSKVNAGFPAWSPDGKTLVYRLWGTPETAETRGLRALNLADNSVKVLTTEWDNFPFFSPQGDSIVFTRRMPDADFEVFTMKPDGSDLKRLTTTAGADAHATWSADGKEIWFESSRTGFKDEAALYDISPQPYAQVFLMNRDGSNVRQLTDSKWEDSMGMFIKRK